MKLLVTALLCLSFISIILPEKNSDRLLSANGNQGWLFPKGFQNEDKIPESFKQIQRSEDLGVIPESFSTQKNTKSTEDILCFEMSYMDEGDEYYYLGSGGENDTLAVVFETDLSINIHALYVQWFSGGTITAYIADYGPASEITPTGDCYDIPRGSTNLSPIGQMRTNPTVNNVDGFVNFWSPAAQLNFGGPLLIGEPYETYVTNQFVVVLVKHGIDPKPMAMNNQISGRTESYTWFGGPWNADSSGTWGQYHQDIELMVMLKFSAVGWGEPPIVNINPLSNTYLTSGERVVWVVLKDLWHFCDNGTVFSDLYYALNGETLDTLTIDDAYPVDDSGGIQVYDYTIEYDADIGDTISYWVVGGTDIIVNTPVRQFEIIEPVNPDADLLIIGDSEDDYYLDGFELAASQEGYEFESWDIHQNMGISQSVVNWGWPYILVVGSAGSVVPFFQNEFDPGFRSFFDSGGNLMLISQREFTTTTYLGLEEATFVSGDPAYDWFGIQSAVSEPFDSDLRDTIMVSLLDELPDLELNHAIYGPGNKTDYLVPADAEPLYRGALSNDVTGVRYVDGISKRAFFSFMADAAVDSLQDGSVYYTPEFFDFFSAMMDWFHVQLGDLTGDAAVDILDIVMMVGYIMGDLSLNPEQIQAADMNDDGAIDVQDAVLMVDVILGG